MDTKKLTCALSALLWSGKPENQDCHSCVHDHSDPSEGLSHFPAIHVYKPEVRGFLCLLGTKWQLILSASSGLNHQ